MAESRRRYQWVAGWDDELSAVAAQQQIATAIERWASRWSWFQGGRVELLDGGRVLVEVTIRGRDQWAVHRRQVRLIAAVAASLRMRRSLFGDPVPLRLPPHGNRGRAAARRVDELGHRVDQDQEHHEVGGTEAIPCGGVSGDLNHEHTCSERQPESAHQT